MRANGSFKSLITGLATVPVSQQGERAYMQECVNMRNDQISGLKRRPGVELVASGLTAVWDAGSGTISDSLSNFNPYRDVLKSFSLGNDDYWMYSQGTYNASTAGLVGVFNKQGESVPCFSAASDYLTNTKGNDSVRLAVSGDSVFVTNNEVQAEMVKDSRPLQYPSSVVAVKFAPTVYSKVVIEWLYPFNDQVGKIEYEIGQDHPEQPIPAIEDVDTGVNTTAFLIGQAIQAQMDADLVLGIQCIFSEDSSAIVFKVDASLELVNYTKRESLYSGVKLSDGTGGAIIAINESVPSINDLPRDFVPNGIVKVQPDAESGAGAFYMQAVYTDGADVPNSGGETPVPLMPYPSINVISADITADQPNPKYQYRSGFWPASTRWGAGGSFDPNLPNDIFPDTLPGGGNENQVNYGFYCDTELPIDDSASTTVTLHTVGPAEDEVPAGSCRYVEIWYREGLDTTAQPFKHTRVLHCDMYKTKYYPEGTPTISGGASHNIWTGTVDTGFAMKPSNGTQFEIYSIHFTSPVNQTARTTSVEWVECSHPTQDTMINPDTMPHVLHRQEDGSFEFGSMIDVSSKAVQKVQARAAGDNISNPPPAFTEGAIRDIAFHQSRMAVLTKDKVSMSVSGQPNDWWRGSVAQLLATGPIDIQSTASAAGDLRSFVSHNGDLMVFGPHGQFRFSGQKALTPQNASLPQAAAYPATIIATPISSGNNVYFPTTYGEAGAGLSQFSLDPQIQNLSVAAPMAAKQIGMMTMDVKQIVASATTGLVALRLENEPLIADGVPDGGGNSSKLYILEFLPDIDILKQAEPTWSIWEYEFGLHIISMRVSGDNIEFMGTPTNGSGNVRLFRQPLHDHPGRPYLDELTGTFGAYNGSYYESAVTLPPIITRDAAGIRMTDAKKRLNSITVSVEGDCNVVVNELLPQYHDGGSGNFVTDVRFQAKSKSNDATIRITSEDEYKMSLNQIEWTGTYYKAGRRF